MPTPDPPDDQIDEHMPVKDLVALVDSTEGVQSWRAAEALVTVGATSVQPLIELLKTQQLGLEGRVRAIDALGRIGDERAIGVLAQLLDDPNMLIRFNATRALGVIGQEDAIPALTGVLSDADTWVREAAERALIRVGQPAVPALIEVLAQGGPDVRRAVVRALGDIRDVRAVEPLRAAVRDEDAVVRWSSVEALGQLRDADAFDLFVTALHDSDPDVRGAAATVLGEFGDTRAMPELEHMAEHDAGKNWEGDPIKDIAQDALEQIRERQGR